MESSSTTQLGQQSAPATAALNTAQQSGQLTRFPSSPQHQQNSELLLALPITVTASSLDSVSHLQSNLHNHNARGSAPAKQPHQEGTTKRASGLLTVPSELARPGRGITLGSVAVTWPPPGGRKLADSAGGYSAASRATVHGMKTLTDPSETSGGLAGKRAHSEPAISAVPTSEPSAGYKYRKVVGGKMPRSASMTFPNELSPQFFLDKMIRYRGYSTQNFCSLEGAYYCKPTPLQIASYGLKTVQAVRKSDAVMLQQMLDCGLSPNPCNVFGESIVHMVCRRGDTKLLKILIDAGCSLQVTDDFGRTPLHDACWTAQPNFELVELILNTDERLLHIVDCRGSSPLSYIKQEHGKEWIQFFQGKAEIYWASRDVSKDGEEPPPKLAGEPPHSRPVPDPRNAATLEQASLISSGQLDVQDVLRQRTMASMKIGIEERRVPVAAPAAC